MVASKIALSVPLYVMFTVGVTVDVPVTVIPLPATTSVTVPTYWSAELIVNVEPARVTVVVPEPVYTIASVLAGF